MSRVFFKQLLLAASLSAALVSAPARAQSEASLVLSACRRRRWWVPGRRSRAVRWPVRRR